MADNEQTHTIDDNVVDAEIAGSDSSSSIATYWLWLAMLLVLLLSVASSWWLYQLWQKGEQQQQQLLDEHSANNEMLTNALKQNQLQLGNLQQTQQQLSEQVSELLSREQLSSSELLNQWALQEIQYLLNVANQRAILAHDISGAKHALNLADKQLEKMANYKLHPLRALIAEEVMALDALADVDVAGIALKLQTAIKHVDSLRVVKGPDVTADTTQAQPAAANTNAGWKQAASDIWQQIRSLVVIRHNQNGDEAVLVPEQRYFLYQNLKLQLESARLALLNRDDASYDYALQTATDWLTRYFTGDERDALLATLQELETQQLDITMPDIADSLNWLEEYQR